MHFASQEETIDVVELWTDVRLRDAHFRSQFPQLRAPPRGGLAPAGRPLQASLFPPASHAAPVSSHLLVTNSHLSSDLLQHHAPLVLCSAYHLFFQRVSPQFLNLRSHSLSAIQAFVIRHCVSPQPCITAEPAHAALATLPPQIQFGPPFTSLSIRMSSTSSLAPNSKLGALFRQSPNRFPSTQ